jgi:hypothetical protein
MPLNKGWNLRKEGEKLGANFVNQGLVLGKLRSVIDWTNTFISN